MIVESAVIDKLTDEVLAIYTPSHFRVRLLVFDIIMRYESQGMDVTRMSAWERGNIRTAALVALRES